MLNLPLLILIVVILALVFDLINGFHDTANSIATSVSTRVLSPAMAILMAAILNFIGALMNTKVASTIGKVSSLAVALSSCRRCARRETTSLHDLPWAGPMSNVGR